MEDKINLTGLMPNFFSLGVETSSQLSALFVSVIICVAAGFLLFTIFFTMRAVIRTNRLKSLLINQSEESIYENRQAIIDRAKKMWSKSGHLWSEFDESLIEVRDRNGNVKVYNTLDANHFFNNSTLAPEITENRLLAAVPGFLTAIGVIGTFVGLQLGLSELNIGNDVDVVEMKAGLAHVISGAKIAFMTSVWGVFLSVIFNFLEKLFESYARAKVRQVQDRIDDVFPRINAESLLEQIATNSYESRETLQGLAEEIGHKMQESVLDATSRIQSGLEASLEKIMTPAMEKLVNVASDGSQQAVNDNQKVLESLVEKFMDRFGELGQTQRESINEASQGVTNALASFNASMNSFLNEIKSNENSSAQNHKELIENMSTQINQMVDHNVEQNKILTNFVEDKLGNLSHILQEREHKSIERDEQRQRAMLSQTTSLQQTTESFLESMQEKMDAQQEAVTGLVNQGIMLQENIHKSTESNMLVSQRLQESSDILGRSAKEMEIFGNHIREAGNQLSGQVAKAVETSKDISSENQRLADHMEKYSVQLQREHEKAEQVLDKLNDLVGNANHAFDNMKSKQSEFLQQLHENVEKLGNQIHDNMEDLAEQMADLLEDYSERANAQTEEHLKIWAQNSTNYAVSMQRAMKALSNIVGDIEDQMSNNGH